MVRVATASGPFHARVIVARLGAAGIVGQARGLDGPYPVLGCVDVLVPEHEAEDASALLAADAREAALGRQVDDVLDHGDLDRADLDRVDLDGVDLDRVDLDRGDLDQNDAVDRGRRPGRASLTAAFALATLVCMAMVALLSELLSRV